MYHRDQAPVLSPAQVLNKLMEGNRRFAADAPRSADVSASRRTSLVPAQHPLAAILTCSDSRVAPEILFDQGLGDLFVVRVAGNVADNMVLGSLEYAVAHLQVPLLMVLGHDHCGAVTAACAHEGQTNEGAVSHVLNAIQPAIARAASHLQAQGVEAPPSVDAVVLENVVYTMGVVQKNPLIHEAAESGALLVVGAVYGLLSGLVTVVEPRPTADA